MKQRILPFLLLQLKNRVIKNENNRIRQLANAAVVRTKSPNKFPPVTGSEVGCRAGGRTKWPVDQGRRRRLRGFGQVGTSRAGMRRWGPGHSLSHPVRSYRTQSHAAVLFTPRLKQLINNKLPVSRPGHNALFPGIVLCGYNTPSLLLSPTTPLVSSG